MKTRKGCIYFLAIHRQLKVNVWTLSEVQCLEFWKTGPCMKANASSTFKSQFRPFSMLYKAVPTSGKGPRVRDSYREKTGEDLGVYFHLSGSWGSEGPNSLSASYKDVSFTLSTLE